MSVRSLFENINRGKKGLNKGIPQGLPKVDSITYGLQRRWMTVIGADSGAGARTRRRPSRPQLQKRAGTAGRRSRCR